MRFKFPTFLVGGAVRDELLGLPCKDLDYVVVAPSFDAMKQMLLEHSCKIFVEKPEFLTIRCNHPKLGSVDFALARKDGVYTDGRRPDSTSIAENLEQDLARRDFTCNAMAKSLVSGNIIDPFGGQKDIRENVLRSVGEPADRLNEDKLRAFRAIRFSITKNFIIVPELKKEINELGTECFDGVSTERIREELFKAFKYDSIGTFSVLQDYPQLVDLIGDRGIWFRPTTES